MYEISLALPMYLISVNAIQVMVLDYKLTYPSGTATAMLINSFHTKSGAELAGYTNFTTQKLLYLTTLIQVLPFVSGPLRALWKHLELF